MHTIETHTGADAARYLPDFQRLSDECLSGWPFFIKPKRDGGQQLVASLSDIVSRLHAVVVMDGGAVVGGTYGHPIRPFGPLAANVAKVYDLSRVYWIAQTTILPSHQGKGISHQIYNARDPWVIASGQYDAIAHVLVERSDRPANHVPYGDMWNKRGYHHLAGADVVTRYADATDNPKAPTEKTLQLWVKPL